MIVVNRSNLHLKASSGEYSPRVPCLDNQMLTQTPNTAHVWSEPRRVGLSFSLETLMVTSKPGVAGPGTCALSTVGSPSADGLWLSREKEELFRAVAQKRNTHMDACQSQGYFLRTISK